MKMVLKWAKRILCLGIILMILFADSSAFMADAASGSITVTNELSGNGELLYSGDSLQDAFDACVRGCVVNVGRRITLSDDVSLKVEVALSGYSNITFAGYRIMLEINGAILSETRFRMSEIAAVHNYSTVEMRRENGSYIYYLITQTPVFGEENPEFVVGNKLFGAVLDDSQKVVCMDLPVDGVLASDMSKLVSFPIDYSVEAKAEHGIENVAITFSGTVSKDDRSYIANGTTMKTSATNFDYEGSVDKTYTIIVLGDVNGNGCIDAADATMIARHAAGSEELTGNALLAADANRDGEVTAADAQLICEKYVRRNSYRSPL